MASPRNRFRDPLLLLGLALSLLGFGFVGWRVSANQTKSAFSRPLASLARAFSPTGRLKPGTYTLTVAKAGTGASEGTVTSNLSGINCGANCSADFNEGEMVTLTASVPNTALAAFLGWGGACTGRGACTVTMDAAQSVTAQFETLSLKKCASENLNLWGLRFTLGANLTPAQCSAQCQQGGGNGYFMVSAPAGTCLCGTSTKPVSTNPATTGCSSTCVGTTAQCGGPSNRYSAYYPGNLPPSITAAATVSLPEGAVPVAPLTLATVDDAETPKASLVVTAESVPTGITFGTFSIDASTGVVSAPVQVAANVPLGNQTITLKVTDQGGASATANFIINVQTPTPPTMANYPNRCLALSVLPGSQQYYYNPSFVSSAMAPFTSSVSIEPNTFMGTIAFTPAGGEAFLGAYTITNPKPTGVYTVTLGVRDSNGLSNSRQFQLTVKPPPTITAVTAVSAQQGSPPGTPLTIATVSDPLTPAGSLIVTQLTGAPDFTLGSITNTNGIITATVVASCNVDEGSYPYSVNLQVADATCPNFTATTRLTVNVTGNSPPTLGNYANACAIAPGGSKTVTPSAPPADNGSVTSFTATVSPSGFTGTLTTNPATGEVTINNAGPIGNYTVMVQARDNCFYPTSKTFQFSVANNNPPTITPATGVTRTQGTPGSNSTIATVNDTESGPSGVTVTVTSANPSNGVTLSNITNTNGTIKADIVADCKAVDASFTLLATDSCGATSTTTLNVSVPKNAAPVLTYDKAQPPVLLGGSLTVNPLTGPSDNGTFSLSYLPDKNSTFTGTVTVDKTTGVVTISKAAPSGAHSIQIQATDNCGLSTFAFFMLNVSEPPPVPPTLGDYPNATVNLSGQGAVTPQTAPTGTGSFTAQTSTSFKGTLAVNPATGVVSVTNAHPAGNYPVTVTAMNKGGMVSMSFTLTVTATPACAPGLLAAAVNYSSGAGAGAIVIGDFNNDSKQDLVTANLQAGTVTIRLGNGDGTFGSGQSFSGSSPAGIAVGDFNGDGWQDLAVGNYTDRSIGIYLGSNKGSFTQSHGTGGLSFISTPSYFAFATADFNHDGKLDLVAATTNNNGVAVLLGKGDGTFGTPGKLAIGDHSSAVVVGDFNQDGHPDIANQNGSAVAVALGNGDGTFAAAVDYAVSRFVSGLTLGDFNSDGKQDLATANSDSTISILPGNGNGTFAAAQSFSLANQPSALATGDFNADGKQDLVASHYQDNSISIFLGNGDGTFGAAANKAVGTGPGSFVVGDFNGDGLQDVATGNYGSGNVSVLLRQCNTAPTIAANGVSRQQGTPASNATLATVSDAEQTAGSLSVTVLSAPAGITISSIANNQGAITANIVADCAATLGDNTVVLKVTDATGLSATANVIVNVTANSAPALGYAQQSALASSSLTINPASATDNGKIMSFSLMSQSSCTSTISIDPATGVLTFGKLSPAGLHSITVRATDDCGLATDATFMLNIACPTVSVSPATLPNGQINQAYNQTLTATPAGTSYSFAVTQGNLPMGLSLNAGSGVLSGSPTQAGTFNFRITATGWGNCTGSRDYTLMVSCSGVSVAPASLPDGAIGAAYNQTLSATPSGSYSFSVTSGTLPPGLALSPGTGTITGTPTTAGTFNFTITASAGGCSGSRNYTVVIACQGVSLSTTALPSGQAGMAYSHTLSVTPAGSYTFTLAQGNLPPGLTLQSSTGLISGLPLMPGTYNFIIRVKLANSCETTQALSITINCPTVTIAPASLPNGTVGASYSQSFSPTPSGGNYGFAVSSGSLPAGLTLNAMTGVLSGTPTTNSTSTFTIKATGFGSCAGTRTYTVAVGTGGGCPTITLPDLPGGSAGQPYNSIVAASPAGNYTYELTAGSLPPGIQWFGAIGMLYGYPATNGTFNFTIKATKLGDSSNCTKERAYTLVIGGASLRAATVNDFSGDRRSDFVLWRAEQQQWVIVDSAANTVQTKQWGEPGDVAVTGDYDGDGKADLAAFGKDGHWRINLSQDGTTLDKVWGLGTDVPVPGDYDGDGLTDLAVWRGAETTWHIQRSSDGQTQTVQWGSSLAPYYDVPVPGDYDGDGKMDVAVFRRANGHWYIRPSSDGAVVDKYWGLETDVPVPADYDGDGKTDIAVWRGSEGIWHILRSSDAVTQTVRWGTAWQGDMPVPGDYDGDGKADVAVWQESTGTWHLRQSGNQTIRTKLHGQTGDKPVTARRP